MGRTGSTRVMKREGEAEVRVMVEGYTDRMRSGRRRPSSFSFILAVMAKVPPAESPANTMCSPVVPGRDQRGGKRHCQFQHSSHMNHWCAATWEKGL